MRQWDGNDYQLYARFAIIVAVGCLVVERFWPHGELFGLGIFILVTTLTFIPEGPQPPKD